jgi:hypothetical protein
MVKVGKKELKVILMCLFFTHICPFRFFLSSGKSELLSQFYKEEVFLGIDVAVAWRLQ